MAKKKKKNTNFNILEEVQYHYQQWTEDRDVRMSRENGWNDILDAYFGKLPENWPYLSHVVDPRLRTTIIEKKARLTNSKLRGRLTPREGGDIVSARINNVLLDFQWDNAREGGTMNYKWGEMDQDARLFGSSFALVTWKCEKDDEEKSVFNGNEFKKLDPRDVGLISGLNVRDAKWVQVSQYLTLDDLENISQTTSEPDFPGLSSLREAVKNSQDRRDANYISRIKQNKGLSDRVGDDKVFPVVEIVTEYRKDRWITFSPKHNLIIRDIDNPYAHGQIPIVQLKYFPLSDDPWGESEVESVLPLWRAIQVTLNSYLDSMNIHMKPPLKILEGLVRMETIEWSPEATWIINQENAITEHVGSGEPLKYFQTTYSALVAAFNTAMGDSSEGVSSIDPFNPEKTATEIKKQDKQQNVRDQDNQNYLSDAIVDTMSMWLVNNRQFLFADDDMQEYVLKIIGEKDFSFFKQIGLDKESLSHESSRTISDVIMSHDGDMSDLQLQQLTQAGSSPLYPVVENPKEKDIEKIRIKPKMSIDDTGKEASIYLTPDDLSGNYDYIPDVRSMSSGADQQYQESRKQATDLLFNNQNVLQLLQQSGVSPNVKEILIEIFEDSGTKDAERFFSETTNSGTAQATGLPEAMAQQGLAGSPTPQPIPAEQMAQPTGF